MFLRFYDEDGRLLGFIEPLVHVPAFSAAGFPPEHLLDVDPCLGGTLGSPEKATANRALSMP